MNFNYRLGPLGFPLGEKGKPMYDFYYWTNPEHFITADRRGALNLALEDQMTALEHDIHYLAELLSTGRV